MTMKSVPAEQGEENDFELEQRKRARAIFEKVFPNAAPTPQLIEAVNNKAVVTDDDYTEIDDEETEVEVGKLLVARAWAKEAYGFDDPAATLIAYDALNNESDADRWAEVNEKLDEIFETLRKRK